MPHERNHLGQPVGVAVPGWQPRPPPSTAPIDGFYCRLERLDPPAHADALHAANALDADGRMWTYLPYGPFESPADYRRWAEDACRGTDPLFYAVIDRTTSRAAGVASYLRIDSRNGTIEVGHIAYSARLQRTPAATEAMYLMMKHAFELGYRRYEWKCNALNLPSRVAAQRLGLSFEGVFRQAAVVKGRNRDTAWYSAIDSEWPALKRAFETWLAPANFDEHGIQRLQLSALTGPLLKQRG